LRHIEIFNVFGSDPSELYLLLHVSEEPDDWETYSSAVVRLTPSGLSLVHRLDAWIQSMWREPDGGIYLAGVDGDIVTDAGGVWQAVPLGRRHSFNHVTGLPDGSLFCCGSQAGVFRGSGAQWTLYNDGLPEDVDLLAVGGTSAADLYAVGKKGAVFHCDGARWVALESPTNRTLVKVLALSPADAFFCGRHGSLLRRKGASWQSLGGITDADFHDMVIHQGRLLVAAGTDGIFRFDGRHLEPFADKVLAGGLQVIGETLFAHYGAVLQVCSEGVWSQMEPDFGALLG
jgi:hypothetical protein